MLQPLVSNIRCMDAARPLYEFSRQWGMSAKPRFRLTYIRQWRQSKGFSLEKLAARIPMDKGNLSKVERGLLPYNQEMLERIADALQTDTASLLIRDPSEPEAIWSLWDRANQGTRRQIASVAETLIRTGTND